MDVAGISFPKGQMKYYSGWINELANKFIFQVKYEKCF